MTKKTVLGMSRSRDPACRVSGPAVYLSTISLRSRPLPGAVLCSYSTMFRYRVMLRGLGLSCAPGRSRHEAILLQDTVANMDTVDLIIASLDVKGAFLNTPWLLWEAVWKRLGLPVYKLFSNHIRTCRYTVRTGVSLTPFL